MSAIHDAHRVATVGAPSTNSDIVLDITADAAHTPLVGQMLFLTHPILTSGSATAGHGEELGLGVVTEVTTINRSMENPDVRVAMQQGGDLLHQFAGDASDQRRATVRLQAAYRRDADADGWRQSGNSLSTSPPTGRDVREVSNDVLDEVIADDDLHYLGHMAAAAARGTKVRVPMNARDYSGPRGAYMATFCGITGSGKTAAASYFFAGQMRFADHGIVIVDPQGQWASEQGMPFSLQGWATELGRDVIVRRISEDLRLEKDSGLFATLLGKTKFTSSLMRMGSENAEILLDELAKVVKRRDDWETEDSGSLLVHLAQTLQDPVILNRVYATQDKQDRLRDALAEIVSTAVVRDEVLRYFAPLHNLFQATNPAGGTRHSLWGTLSGVFDKQARAGAPAPLLILDMSTTNVSWVSTLLAEDEQMIALDALAVLDQDAIKAAILRQTFATLKRASEAAFRDGDNLNTQIVLDEAWRYAPPPGNATVDEIAELSRDLAGYSRDTRKFGIGWTYITQSPRSINSDIWDQTSVRFLGYGLAGPDLERVAEQLDDRDHLRLYRGFAPPDAVTPHVYPFMALGPVSPLSFTKAPVFIAIYTDFDEFRADNHSWIYAARASLGLPLLAGVPAKPGQAAAAVTRSAARGTGRRVSKRETDEAAARVRGNRATGGVDPASAAYLTADDGFGTAAIDAIDTDTASWLKDEATGRPIDPATGTPLPF